MKVSTEIDNNFGYEKITQLVDNIPLIEVISLGHRKPDLCLIEYSVGGVHRLIYVISLRHR